MVLPESSHFIPEQSLLSGEQILKYDYVNDREWSSGKAAMAAAKEVIPF